MEWLDRCILEATQQSWTGTKGPSPVEDGLLLLLHRHIDPRPLRGRGGGAPKERYGSLRIGIDKGVRLPVWSWLEHREFLQLSHLFLGPPRIIPPLPPKLLLEACPAPGAP